MLALWLTWITRVVMVAVLGLFAAPFVWEVASQDSFMTVTGRSMEPTYRVGDVLSVRPPTGHDLETVGVPVVVASTPGDPSTQYVHRVYEVVDGGARLKGDNNSVVDPLQVDQSHVVGTPRFAVTGVYAVVFAATQSWVMRGIVAVAIVAVIFLPGTRPGRHRGVAVRGRKAADQDSNEVVENGAVVNVAGEEPVSEESVFSELVRKGTLGCAALVAAVGLAVVVDPGAALASPASPSSVSDGAVSVGDGGLEVSPGAGLFDVALSPGDVEYASATVTNRSDSPLRVGVSAVTVAWEGVANPSDHILLGASAGHPCAEGVAPFGSATVTAMVDLFIGVIAPGVSTEVCMAAVLPVDTAMVGWGLAVVDLVFSGMGAPGVGLPGGGLAFTGFVVSGAVVVGVLLALIVGMILVARSRRAVTR